MSYKNALMRAIQVILEIADFIFNSKYFRNLTKIQTKLHYLPNPNVFLIFSSSNLTKYNYENKVSKKSALKT